MKMKLFWFQAFLQFARIKFVTTQIRTSRPALHPYGDCPPPRRDDWGSITADVHQDLFEASKDKTDVATTSVSGGKEQTPELDERSKTKLKPDTEVDIDDVNLDGQSEVSLPETIARTTDVLDRATPGQNMMGFSR